jgi:hypothetical protein
VADGPPASTVEEAFKFIIKALEGGVASCAAEGNAVVTAMVCPS